MRAWIDANYRFIMLVAMFVELVMIGYLCVKK